MKTNWILTFFFVLSLSGDLLAQNVEPTKGVGSVITFTNTKGEEVKDATVRAVTYDGIIWLAKNQEGKPFGGRVNFSDLPQALASEFGYDPKKAAEINAATASAAAEKNAQAAARRAEMWRASQAALTKMTILGTVTQVTTDGILVTAESQRATQTTTQVNPTGRNVTSYAIIRTGPPTEDGSPLFVGRCLITDGDTAGWTDDQMIRAVVYPNGTYTYKAVSGASLTIDKFTLNPAKVTNPPTTEKFEMLKRTYKFNTPVETRR